MDDEAPKNSTGRVCFALSGFAGPKSCFYRYHHLSYVRYLIKAPYENTALAVNKKFGLELIAKRTDTFLKTTSGPALAR